MGSIPEFSVQRSRALRPRGLWASGGKRLFDVVLSATALLVLSPLLLALALWVRLDSPGPALYRQRRVGRYGREFVIHKFRTMVSDPRGQGALFTVTGDARITRSGVWLRHTKLDELPQLFDVLRGCMSLVGPRPEVARYVAHYDDEVRHRLLSVRPGLTDYASIEYRHEGDVLAQAADPEKEYVEVVLPRKLQLSLRYVNDMSALTDLRVLVRTAQAIVR
jgi:lipopolysaccharide/colanic/teichoic acid biosynthesis glycosyltransferase